MLFLPLYIIGFLVSALALVGWFYFQRSEAASRLFRTLLFAGLGVYLLGSLMSGGDAEIKLGAIVRDLLLLGGIGIAFQFLLRKRPAFIFGLAALGLLLAWYQRNYLQQGFEAPMPALDAQGELLVELREGVEPAALEALLEKYELRMERAFSPAQTAWTDLDDYYVVDLPAKLNKQVPAIQRLLQRQAAVEWVEPNEVINIDPTSPAKLPDTVRRRFGVNDPGLEQLWGFQEMEVDKLYTLLRDRNVKPVKKALVAILDTGVDGNHEDLKANYRSIRQTYDDDPRGHGTHCAGIAAAVSNNGLGVASLAPDNGFVEVSSIKVLSAMGSGTQRTIINGMLEAADKGAAVISMSLGGRSNQSRQKAYEKAVDYANKAGAIVVAAAGNSNRSAREFSPVNANGIIGVSAVDEELNRAVFSNTVSDISYGIAAPGVNIYSTIPGSKYAVFSGTSMATPYVAGLVGMLKSIKPELTTQQIHRLLKETGRDTRASAETGRFIQPEAAVRRLLDSGN